jgi:hypothetical protein
MMNLNIPVLVFGSMIAVLIGSVVHLIAGGKLIRLIFCMLFAWLGFWIGNFTSTRFGINILRFGQIDYGSSIIFSIIFSIFGFWLSGENRNRDS